MPAIKSQQLQIRVTAAQKAALKRLARRAGQGVSAYVLSRALPSTALRFEALLLELRDEGRRRFAFAELHDLLDAAAPVELADALRDVAPRGLPPLVQNQVAAMVELAAHRKGTVPPAWVREIPPLPEPHFATSLRSLRAHLLVASPVPFRRRNLFVDSSIGDRV